MSLSPSSPSTAVSSSSSFLQTISNLGLGYAIAITLAALIILSSLLLAFYLCSRSRNPNPNPNTNPNTSSTALSLPLPRVIFVTEDDDNDDVESGGVVGLDAAAINSYPKFTYSGSKGESTCPICLCEYREGEMMRMMPDCRHCFHLMCIDAWLRLNSSCPVCRTSPMPTPVSTPLAEVVPLAQFAADRRRSRS